MKIDKNSSTVSNKTTTANSVKWKLDDWTHKLMISRNPLHNPSSWANCSPTNDGCDCVVHGSCDKWIRITDNPDKNGVPCAVHQPNCPCIIPDEFTMYCPHGSVLRLNMNPFLKKRLVRVNNKRTLSAN